MYLDKQKFLEDVNKVIEEYYKRGMYQAGNALRAMKESIESGTFDTDNHLRTALERIRQNTTGWKRASDLIQTNELIFKIADEALSGASEQSGVDEYRELIRLINLEASYEKDSSEAIKNIKRLIDEHTGVKKEETKDD